MKSLRIILAAGACITAGALFGPTFATATVDKMRDVIVRNEDPIPVDVRNTPTVAVGNTPTVTVGNTPAVRIDNVPTVAEAGTPVQFQGRLVFFGERRGFDEPPYTVPDDKRLRIDQITFEDDTPAVVELLRISTTVNGVSVRHRIATRSQGADGDVATERVSLYADPGSKVRFEVALDRRIGDETTGLLMIPSFSGVLLDG